MAYKAPYHIGIIMDGNRRWARKRGLPTLQGHQRGYNKIKKVGDWCLKRGVKILSVYAFSTENWNRSKKEVGYLMRLLHSAIENDTQEMHEKGIRMMFSGRLKDLQENIQQAINRAVELTKNNTNGILNICINYGGRAEIVDAVKKIVKMKKSSAQITENLIDNNLYSPSLPDPDIVIRTSGEQRLSGYLTWESVYSELYFIKKPWPAFTEKDLDEVLTDYENRHRRFGH
ncbi:polyprenyl diphosphate synthase [Patescibacteria group bacterium]